MKVYPAIYESTDGDIYLYKDRCNYYSFRHKNWIVGDQESILAADTDKNITREYLNNTDGKVKNIFCKRVLLKSYIIKWWN